MSLLDTPIRTAEDLWQEVRLAHTGGRRLQGLLLTADTEQSGALAGVFHPELGASYRARLGFDFLRREAWQVAQVGTRRYLWHQGGERLRTEVDGESYRPLPGLDRGQHLKTWMWLIRPADVEEGEVTPTLLSPANGRMRLRLTMRTPPQDQMVLEVDRSSGLVVAADFTVRELRLPFALRAEFSEHRNVGNGVMIPHQVSVTVPVPGAQLPLWTVQISNVSATVESAFPGRKEGPGFIPELFDALNAAAVVPL